MQLKRKLSALLASALLVTTFASCASEPLPPLSDKLTLIPGEEPPPPVVYDVDFAQATDDELNEYMSGYESLKAEITGSSSTVDIPDGANVYYVSNNGDNKNDGITPETPFSSVTRANLFAKPGDVILFECGSIFREPLALSKGITYSSYGEGKKPRFYGSWESSDPSLWIETDTPNVYMYDRAVPEVLDVGQIVFDGGKQWGIKVMKINSEDLRVDQGECFNGIDTFNNGGGVFTGYKDLKSNLEFYCDPVERRMYLYCEYGNPAEHFESIEVVKRGNIAAGSADNVKVDNLCFMYGGSHGIGVGNAKNFEISYCEFYYIGGSIQSYDIFGGYQPTRFGNAVENWQNADNYKIHHCYASQIYDCCYTTQWQGDSSGADVVMRDVEFSYNIAEYANTGLEVWMGDNVGYDDAEYKFENFDLHHNYTMYSGYGWSHQRPTKDGNFVYGGVGTNTTKHVNSVFHDNVFMYAKAYGLLAYYTVGEPNGHVFRDNTYVMDYDAVFANSASVNDGELGDARLYKFTEAGIDEAQKAGIDKGSRFRYVIPEGGYGPSDKPTRYTLEEYIKYSPYYTFAASSGNTYPVNIILPEKFDENKSYPLVVYLHAEYQAGDNGTSHVLNNNPFIKSLYTEATDDDAVILAMQLPKSMTWTDTGKRDEVYTYSEENEPAALRDLDELVELALAGTCGFRADKKKLSLVGQSNGGTAVYDLLTRYPNKYARAAIAGAATAENIDIGKTELKIFHGGKDIFFDERTTASFADSLDGSVSYKSFPQEDHNVWSAAFDRELSLWVIGK